ncbi:MAG: hypothetical protein WA938_06390 [Candidatus Dormiibacterota bacterium]
MEEAALEGWPTEAKARVVRLEVHGDRADVLVHTEPSHRMRVECMRRDGRWYALGEWYIG